MKPPMSIMSQEAHYFNVEEQSKYSVKVAAPTNMEDLSDAFITREELQQLTGNHGLYVAVNGKSAITTVLFHTTIEAELTKYAERLDVSSHKSILIEDDELVEALKDGRARHVMDYIGRKYCRHGDRLRYFASRRRVKRNATKGDMRDFWSIFSDAFSAKYGTYLPHAPIWYRTLKLFKAYQKILGWRRCRKHMNKDNAKFYRQVWDNPEEYI